MLAIDGLSAAYGRARILFDVALEALREREVLLQLAPHIVRPLRFVLPAYPGPRSAVLLRIGLFLYDHLGGRKILPGTRTVDLTHSEVGAPLKRRYLSGFEYSDCWVDDARLVVLNAMDAHERGASIRTRTRVAYRVRVSPPTREPISPSSSESSSSPCMITTGACPSDPVPCVLNVDVSGVYHCSNVNATGTLDYQGSGNWTGAVSLTPGGPLAIEVDLSANPPKLRVLGCGMPETPEPGIVPNAWGCGPFSALWSGIDAPDCCTSGRNGLVDIHVYE